MTTLKKTNESVATPAPATSHALAASPAPAAPAQRPLGKAAEAKAGTRKAAVKKNVVKKAPVKKVAARPLLSKAAAPAQPVKASAPQKTKKPKLVRDSFTIPKAEYGVLEELKQRAVKLARPVKKSELLRAGIKMLASLTDAAYLAALEQVPTIKTGRPALRK